MTYDICLLSLRFTIYSSLGVEKPQLMTCITEIFPQRCELRTAGDGI